MAAPSYGVLDLHVNAKVAEFGDNNLMVLHMYSMQQMLIHSDPLNNYHIMQWSREQSTRC